MATVVSDDPNVTARPVTSFTARPERAGTAILKPEYLLSSIPLVESLTSSSLNDRQTHPFADDDEAEAGTSTAVPDARDAKRQRPNKRDKERTGQNKARSFPVVREAGVRMCRVWEQTGVCPREGCKFAHDWSGYFATKPQDIHYEAAAEIRGEPPYVSQKGRIAGGEDELGRTVDGGTDCPVFRDMGYCSYGWRCRFLGGHVRRVPDVSIMNRGGGDRIGEWDLLARKEDASGKEGAVREWKHRETNWPDHEVTSQLRNNSYEYPFSEKYLHHIEPHKPFNLTRNKRISKPTNGIMSEEDALNVEEAMMSAPMNGTNGHIDGETEAMDVPLRPEEKRRLNWKNGLYLAPLTTVGNLPFRRLCVSYGATITCSEMALAQPLVSGHPEEWALVRRHESEKMFGVQLAGGYANRMVPAAELVKSAIGDGVDFVDVNLGCPLDLVFNQGAGSALMDSPGRLGKILIGMNRALGEIPLTVKFRTGVATGKPNAHKLIPRFATQWGAGAMTLHGRSRQQRYSKLADWAYIRECAEIVRASLSDAGLPPVPFFGGGDCFSSQGYYEEKEASGVDGIMVARGALIKPWIFTEIAERREWDISATERFEGIRKYAEFGLSHWGSDTQGISITRRFLCEALSFQHRYIPIGLLETLPPKMNERPPAYKGRNELETLLSSPFSGDWVKISEMFLGKAEDSWSFMPKHKSNAYGGEEAQG